MHTKAREKNKKTESLIFINDDLLTQGEGYNDALVITMDITNTDVERVIFNIARKLKISPDILWPNFVRAKCTIELEIELGTAPRVLYATIEFVFVKVGLHS